MEQIPTEVIEKIIAEAKKHQLGQYVWQEDKRKSFALGASYGYQLASPCALCEGKEKEIAELKEEFKANYFLTESLYKEISQLEAENERLKGLLHNLEEYFDDRADTEDGDSEDYIPRPNIEMSYLSEIREILNNL